MLVIDELHCCDEVGRKSLLELTNVLEQLGSSVVSSGVDLIPARLGLRVECNVSIFFLSKTSFNFHLLLFVFLCQAPFLPLAVVIDFYFFVVLSLAVVIVSRMVPDLSQPLALRKGTLA